MKIQAAIKNIDWPLFIAIIILCLLGLINLYSVLGNNTYKLLTIQIFCFITGILIMFAFTIFDYNKLQRLSYPIYIIAVFLLVFVLFKGKAAQGAQRWLMIGGVKFQVSEFMKLAMILIIARWYHVSTVIGSYNLRNLILPAILVVIPFGLIVKQPDLGSALMIAFTAISMILFARINLKSFLIIASVVMIAVPLTWHYSLKDYQKKRLTTFVDPIKDPKGAGYNVIQSKIAIGSGKFFGKGFKKGTQKSGNFIPAHHTDFIFSVWAEEQGFFGSTILIGLYIFIFIRILRVVRDARDKFGIFLAFGAGASIFWYAIINLAMVMELTPVVGIPLPFFSYGGTAMIINFTLLGLIFNINARKFIYQGV